MWTRETVSGLLTRALAHSWCSMNACGINKFSTMIPKEKAPGLVSGHPSAKHLGKETGWERVCLLKKHWHDLLNNRKKELGGRKHFKETSRRYLMRTKVNWQLRSKNFWKISLSIFCKTIFYFKTKQFYIYIKALYFHLWFTNCPRLFLLHPIFPRKRDFVYFLYQLFWLGILELDFYGSRLKILII